MLDIRTRYPGAQPFSDDEFSRKMFFGRDQASTALTDQILANRMVVVYAKSGLGKTSLLSAGVAPRLREDRYLPLFVRVNDVERGPFASVLDGIRLEAERQRVEYVPGATGSLWSFFKTVEFWRGDLLLTPVLILDQFEELFTLQPEQARQSFLNELGYLVRGVRPSSAPDTDRALGEEPPPLRIVLSLREDFLGFLEEASDHIPQILDHRFRLAPLSLPAAADAITGPASIDDPGFATKPFRFDGDAITEILDYLSRRRTKSNVQTTRYVEPFQLQLVCRRIEEIVAERQRTSSETAIGMKDIGGEAGIRETLRNFYTSAVGALPTKRMRRAIRRLCEQFLISPEGRRLSLEEMEIRKQLNLSPETLRLLVTRRLLRSENRSDSSYYELSHDALIEPILATRRRKALLFGWLGLGITSIAMAVLSIGFIYNVFYAIQQPVTPEWTNNLLGMPFLASLGIILLWLFRRNLRTLRRYRPRTPEELADTLVAGQSGMSISYGIIGILMGGYILVLAIFLGTALTWNILNAYRGNLAHTDPFSAHFRQSISETGLGLDTIAYIISVPVVLRFGVRLLRWGIRRLLQTPLILRPESTVVSPRTLDFSDIALVAGLIVLLTAVFLAGTELAKIGCAYHLQGPFLDWAPINWFNFLHYDCQKYYRTEYPRIVMFYTLTFVVAFIAEATLLFVRRFKVRLETYSASARRAA